MSSTSQMLVREIDAQAEQFDDIYASDDPFDELWETPLEVTTWEAEELRTALAWLRDERKDDLFALWRLFAYTGMRRSEALALRWKDINTKTQRISIRRAVNTVDWSKTKTVKTGSPRVIDVDDDTLKALAKYKVARAELSFILAKPEAFVFADEEGKLRSPDSVTDRWSRRLN